MSDCSNSFNVLPGYVLDRRPTTLQAIQALPAAYAGDGQGTPTSVSVLIVTATASDSGGVGASGISAASADGACGRKTVGTGVGLGVGLPLLIALLTALFFLFRAQKKIRQLEQQGSGPMHAGVVQRHAWTDRKVRSETDGTRIYEAPGHDQG